jgi:hypothetical protein
MTLDLDSFRTPTQSHREEEAVNGRAVGERVTRSARSTTRRAASRTLSSAHGLFSGIDGLRARLLPRMYPVYVPQAGLKGPTRMFFLLLLLFRILGEIEKKRAEARAFCRRLAMAGEEPMTEYEKQRLARIRGNEARLEALGLRSLAASPLLRNPSTSAAAKRKQKGRSAEDEEYVPFDEGGGRDEEEEEGSSSESGQDDEGDGGSKASSRLRAKVPPFYHIVSSISASSLID